jgi:large repetitive protein
LLNGTPYSSGGAIADGAPEGDGFDLADPAAPAAPTIAVATSTTLTGTAAAGSVVTILAGDEAVGTTTADLFGNWTFDLELSKGLYEFEATATDGSGLTSLESDSVTVRIRRRK